MKGVVQMKVFHAKDLNMKEILPGAQARFVHSEHMTLAEWHFAPGTDLPQHSHKHEQITKVISGTFVLTIDNEPVKLLEGTSVVIPPHAVHSGKAITACHLIDAFYPVREDFK